MSGEEEEPKIVSHRQTTQIAVLFSFLLLLLSFYSLITREIQTTLLLVAVIFTIGFFALIDETNYLLHRIEKRIKAKNG